MSFFDAIQWTYAHVGKRLKSNMAVKALLLLNSVCFSKIIYVNPRNWLWSMLTASAMASISTGRVGSLPWELLSWQEFQREITQPMPPPDLIKLTAGVLKGSAGCLIFIGTKGRFGRSTWLPPWKFNSSPLKWMVGRWVSFWEFSGDMLNFGGLRIDDSQPCKKKAMLL